MLQVITDLIMVGRISAFAVAAVGLGLQSLMFVFAVLTVLHVGTSALLSRFVGAGRMNRASTGLSTLLRFAFSLSLSMMLLWYILASNVYVWFGTVQEVIILVLDYFLFITWIIPFVFL